MTPQEIKSKLTKGDQIRFRDNTVMCFEKPLNPTQGLFFNKAGIGNNRRDYKNIISINGKLLEIKVNNPIITPDTVIKKYYLLDEKVNLFKILNKYNFYNFPGTVNDFLNNIDFNILKSINRDFDDLIKINGKPINEIKINKPSTLIIGKKYDIWDDNSKKYKKGYTYKKYLDKFTTNGEPTPIHYFSQDDTVDVRLVYPEEVEKEVKPSINNLQEMNIEQILKEELDNVIQNQKDEVATFEEDPLEYIINKYPSLNEALIDLMSPVFRDYITGIYVMSPKPTTFKVLLHNGQSFYMIYNPKSYIAKIAGKQYYLSNIKDEEYAVKAISKLLLMGMPPGSQGPESELTNEKDMKDEFVSDLTSEPEVGGEQGTTMEPEKPEEELKEVEEPKVKKFRIVR